MSVNKAETRRMVLSVLSVRTVPLKINEIKAAIDYEFGASMDVPSGKEIQEACEKFVEDGLAENHCHGRIEFFKLKE